MWWWWWWCGILLLQAAAADDGCAVAAGWWWCMPPAAGVMMAVAAAGWYRHRHAPRSGSCCIVFTDIQGSTQLWGALPPTVMANALRYHNRVVRSLIAVHGLYEVKTLGDGFMCVGRCPDDAVRFALDVQRGLLADRSSDTRWINVFYDDDGGGGDDEPAAWHGLRVRIGIHVGGAGEWRSVWDPVQHRFDYHGPAVNLAARIVNRAQGGQTLVSAAVRSADDDTAATVCWTDLGPHHHLRGIDEPVHLYQALPTDEPLCRRTFLLQRRASSSAVLRWPNIHHTLTVLSLPDEGGDVA